MGLSSSPSRTRRATYSSSSGPTSSSATAGSWGAGCSWSAAPSPGGTAPPTSSSPTSGPSTPTSPCPPPATGTERRQTGAGRSIFIRRDHNGVDMCGRYSLIAGIGDPRARLEFDSGRVRHAPSYSVSQAQCVLTFLGSETGRGGSMHWGLISPRANEAVQMDGGLCALAGQE